MTQLRQRMTDDMTVRGLAENTKKSYLNSVAGLATSLSSQPRPDLRSGSPALPPPFARTEGVDLAELQLRSPRRPLPVPHHARFARPALLCAGCQDAVHPASDPQPRRARAAVYRDHQPQASRLADDGLRRRASASELGRLQVRDIDSERMCLRVDQGKGNKDRYVPLSPRLLEELREYWRRHRPRHWLFPSGLRSRTMMTRAGPAHIYKAAKDKAGIDKPGGIHTLRHCYATGLLEAGVELHVIQRRLGHSSIRSTMRYLHLAHDKTSSTPSPLDLLEFPRAGQS